ncbi:DUF771 domain-containing protein [Carnobacteriaceae bacterium zg-ZUI252]|nr:DUF771 domain-containing protein [Carnobacteriaceae bacterium zg-ZUI252]
MNALKMGIYEIDNQYYTLLDDNLALLKERNELMHENIKLKQKIIKLEKVTGTLEDLKEIVGYQDLATLKEKLLLPFKNELDCSVSSEGCIIYPNKKGKAYKVNLIKFKGWYQSHFEQVHKES